MKKNIYSIICAFLLMTACSESFIDLLPISSVTIDNYYKTDKDFSDALTGVYASIRSQYANFYIFGDTRADDSFQEVPKVTSNTFADNFTLNSSDGLMNSTWQNYYQAIFRANILLEKIESVDAATVPNKNRYIGEARFNRALCYFDLIRIFGPVPAHKTPPSVDEAYKTPREPVANIYNDIIIPDLQAAEGSLPPSYTGNDVGRPTIGAAKALLGRVYLTMGDFQKAESKLREVTSLGYKLVDDFNALYDYSNKRHSEYIYNIEYVEGTTNGSPFSNTFLPVATAFTAYHGVVGLCYERNNPTYEFAAMFEEGDLRKNKSVGPIGGCWTAEGTWIAIPSTTNRIYTQKYIWPTPVANGSAADWKVIRYADVLLMLAEAMNENGKTAEAIPYLNMIRKRAGLSEFPTTMSKKETFDAIELERRFELCFEGHRWFDLLRWGKAYEVMKDKGMTDYMTLFPIPLRQVQLINDPAILPQNPGY